MAGLTPDPISDLTSDSAIDLDIEMTVEPVLMALRSEQLDKAITAIITAFGDLDLIARSWSVDPDEVAAELETVGDTADRVALQLLQTYNPQ